MGASQDDFLLDRVFRTAGLRIRHPLHQPLRLAFAVSPSKLATDKKLACLASVSSADCLNNLYQGEDRHRWSDGSRLLEAGSEKSVDALKDRIFLAHEFQHPRSSLPCWISLLLQCGGGEVANRRLWRLSAKVLGKLGEQFEKSS